MLNPRLSIESPGALPPAAASVKQMEDGWKELWRTDEQNCGGRMDRIAADTENVNFLRTDISKFDCKDLDILLVWPVSV